MPRLFEINGFTDASGKVLSLEKFKLFTDLETDGKIDARYHEDILAFAETFIGKEYPAVLATDYMAYPRTGERATFESKVNPRRRALIALTNAEIVENKGRFIDDICNLLWMIMEESTWVVSAHNQTGQPLSPEYDTFVEGLDLFAATTGAAVAFTYYTLKDKLDAVTPVLGQRMLMLLKRRVIHPFINAKNTDCNRWTGTRERHPNNWCPWICSNALWITAVAEEDIAVREAVVNAALEYLDNFIDGYAQDGGCDEGPGYWGAAGASYMDCLETIMDMTDRKISIFHEPLIKAVVEYIAKVLRWWRLFP